MTALPPAGSDSADRRCASVCLGAAMLDFVLGQAENPESESGTAGR
jgi:hypothetical protein